MGKYIDLTGQKFGRLTVLHLSEKPNGVNSKEKFWLCQCDCGKHKIVRGYHLRKGRTKSCGCITVERIKKLTQENPYKKHGMSNERIYKNYHAIKARCYNPNCEKYAIYGGRGVVICDEWLGENGFLNFYNWAVSHGYEEHLTIDRIDVDGNYEPSNCRWVNSSLQGFNRHMQSNNTTGHIGVSRLPNGRFRAYIKKNNRQFSLGWHDNFEDAVSAREEAEKKFLDAEQMAGQ